MRSEYGGWMPPEYSIVGINNCAEHPYVNGLIFLSRRLRGRRVGVDDWLNDLPESPKELESMRTLRSEFWDLERIANRLGYTEAARLLCDTRWEAKRPLNASQREAEMKPRPSWFEVIKTQTLKGLAGHQNH